MKEGYLFSDDTIPETKDSSYQQIDADDSAERAARTRRSALWAAYGDALGWISELTDEAGLMRRTRGEPLAEPVTWKRRIGGRTGITASLPKGCYSDDSQLRLATSRAIRADGFDVEAFAKVELPIWLSYALGGGRSTTAAAEHLAKTRSPWFANTFKGWTASGGNGAAMRVQPHVWAARTPDNPDSFLPAVVRNSICTHSHATGLMGAVLHALCVARALGAGRSPSRYDLDTAIEVAERLPEIMASDTELGYWRSAFEQESGPFSDAWAREVQNTRDALRVVGATGAAGAQRYKDMVDGLNLRDPLCRGSGMLTAVAAVALTWCETRPMEAMRIAANELGTDTDTIATMAGAILGAATEADPPVEVLDADLFRSEADRLAEIADGGKPPNHAYPDLLHWSAPMIRADALICSKDKRLKVRGLGSVAKPLSEPIPAPQGDFRWQWIRLDFGQTMLIKRRCHLAFETADEAANGTPIAGARPVVTEVREQVVSYPSKRADQNASQTSAGNSRPTTPTELSQMEDPEDASSLQAVLSYVEEHIDNDARVGRALRRVVSKGTPGEIHEFAGKLIDLLRDPPLDQ